jgi:hypothetical protein
MIIEYTCRNVQNRWHPSVTALCGQFHDLEQFNKFAAVEALYGRLMINPKVHPMNAIVWGSYGDFKVYAVELAAQFEAVKAKLVSYVQTCYDAELVDKLKAATTPAELVRWVKAHGEDDENLDVFTMTSIIQ